jgi:hypothetical protein
LSAVLGQMEKLSLLLLLLLLLFVVTPKNVLWDYFHTIKSLHLSVLTNELYIYIYIYILNPHVQILCALNFSAINSKCCNIALFTLADLQKVVCVDLKRVCSFVIYIGSNAVCLVCIKLKDNTFHGCRRITLQLGTTLTLNVTLFQGLVPPIITQIVSSALQSHKFA